MKSVLLIYRLTWCFLGMLLVLLGGPNLFQAISQPPPGPPQPSYSSDAFLAAVTGSRFSSDRLSKLLAALPGQKPILILVPERDSSSQLLGQTIGYLACPREVKTEEIAGEAAVAQHLNKISPDSVSAIAFCGMEAPSYMPHGIQLGHNNTLIPVLRKQ